MDEAAQRRVGDRERREVDDHLRQAHDDGVLTLTEYDERAAQCWAARTRADLDALTRDLPEPRRDPEPVVEVRPGGHRTGARGRGRTVVTAALVGVALLAGGNALRADDATSVFGSRVLQVPAQQSEVEVGVAFGSVEVVVPDDARVTTRGTLLFGSTNCAAACDGTGAREVVVDASGAFGSVDVVRQGERAQRDGGESRNDDRDGDVDRDLDDD